MPTELPPVTRSLLLLPLLGLAACATPRAGDLDYAATDPWEKTNRRIFALNNGIDRYALRPAADVYRTVVPRPARNGIHNALNNYNEPLNFTNAVLQGKISGAFRVLDRFIVNTTVGLGGLIDVASSAGRPEEPHDYGQTFAVWGIKSGPFLMLPLFGPSTVRDGVGTVLDLAANPADLARNAIANPAILWRIGQASTQVVDLRARVSDQGADKMMADSLDAYTLVKSAWLQRRVSQIWDGNPPLKDEEILDEPLSDEPLPDPAAKPPGAAPEAAQPAGTTPEGAPPEPAAPQPADTLSALPSPPPAAPAAPGLQTPAPAPAEAAQD